MEYSLIDNTGLIHGPYATFKQARDRADKFPSWEIVSDDGDTLFDWSPATTPQTVVRGPWKAQPKRYIPHVLDHKLMQSLFRRSHRDQLYRARLVSIYRANILEGKKP